jgi:hypothetical protein
MNSIKVISVLILLLGIAALTVGLIIYWYTLPVSPWASVLVLIGILLMLGAIILLCIGIHYDLEQSIERIQLSSQIK